MWLVYSAMVFESLDITSIDEFFLWTIKAYQKISNSSILAMATHNYEIVKKYCNRVFKRQNTLLRLFQWPTRYCRY